MGKNRYWDDFKCLFFLRKATITTQEKRSEVCISLEQLEHEHSIVYLFLLILDKHKPLVTKNWLFYFILFWLWQAHVLLNQEYWEITGLNRTMDKLSTNCRLNQLYENNCNVSLYFLSKNQPVVTSCWLLSTINKVQLCRFGLSSHQCCWKFD